MKKNVGIMPYLRHEKTKLIITLPLIIITVFLEVSIPLIIKDILETDDIQGSLLFSKLLLLISIALLIGVCSYLSKYLLALVSNKITKDIQKETLLNIYKGDYVKFEKYKKGEVINRILDDTKAISQMINEIFPLTLSSFLYTISSIIILFTMDTILAVISVSMLVLYLISFSYFNKRIIKIYRQRVKENDNLMDSTNDIISGVKDVKLWRIEKNILDFYEKVQLKYFNSVFSLVKIKNLSKEIYSLIKTFANILLIVIGFYFVTTGLLNFGILVVFILYLNSLYTPIIDLFDAVNDYNKCLENLKRVFEFKDQNDNLNSNTKSKTFSYINSIELKDVTFSFGENKILNNISLRIEKNMSYALVGKTGCGKSTLLNILLGIYKPTSGEIYVNDKLVNYNEYKDICNFSYSILQDSHLYNLSLEDNINIFNNIDNIKNVISYKLNKVFLNELYSRRSDLIGINGKNLSGGQNQRLLLTRIFNKSNDFVVLDEVTSALDGETEMKLLDSIFEYHNNSILLFCSHQIQVLEYVDNIIRIEGGTASIESNISNGNKRREKKYGENV